MNEKPAGMGVAAILAGAFTILMIATLFVLEEANEPLHDFLIFIPAVGALSGKIIVSYSAGLVVFLLLAKILRNRNPNMLKWAVVAVAIVAVSAILSLTPVIDVIIGK